MYLELITIGSKYRHSENEKEISFYLYILKYSLQKLFCLKIETKFKMFWWIKTAIWTRHPFSENSPWSLISSICAHLKPRKSTAENSQFHRSLYDMCQISVFSMQNITYYMYQISVFSTHNLITTELYRCRDFKYTNNSSHNATKL